MSGGFRARRVLVLACNFPPDASVGTMRTLRLVRHLTEEGWGVTAVTVAPEGFRAGTVIDQALLDKVPGAVRVVRARPLRPFERLAAALKPGRPPAPSTSPGGPVASARVPGPSSRLSVVRRAVTAVLSLPDREVSWLLPAVLAGWRASRHAPPDVLYSSGPPFTAHLAALVLSRLTRTPWVADFRDPWARAPWREDRFAFERRAWAIFERMVATRAHAVVFATRTNRDDFARAYGPAAAARFVVVPNGCDARDFQGLIPADNSPERFVLLHAGSLYGARNPAGLLRALAATIVSGRLKASSFRLRFLGRIGIPGVDLAALARELGLADVVEFVSHVPRRASLQQMLDASALLIVQPVTTVSIPAKLYEYMAAGRPILALAEPGGETAALVENARAGITVVAEDDAAIAAGLVDVVAMARAFAPVDRSVYDGDVRAAELRGILEQTADSAGARR